MTFTEQINEDLKQAMKKQDQAALRAIRAIKSALIIAQTAEGGDGTVSDESGMKILQKLAKQRRESIEIYQSQKRDDLVKKEAEELTIIEKYLPQQMGETELKNILNEIIKESAATGPQDMGRVMGVAMKKLAGKADGKTISTLVQQLLAAKS